MLSVAVVLHECVREAEPALGDAGEVLLQLGVAADPADPQLHGSGSHFLVIWATLSFIIS